MSSDMASKETPLQTAVQPEQGAADDPMWERWKLEMPRLYDAIYYQINPIITYVDRAGHVLLERPFSANDHFSSVLEVGGGTGQHIAHVRHGFDRYVFTDIDPLLLDIAEQRTPARPGLTFEQQDATHLTYSDGTFDRLISVFNL